MVAGLPGDSWKALTITAGAGPFSARRTEGDGADDVPFRVWGVLGGGGVAEFVEDAAGEEVPDKDVAGFAAAEDDAVGEAEGAADAVVGVCVLLGVRGGAVVRKGERVVPQALCRL